MSEETEYYEGVRAERKRVNDAVWQLCKDWIRDYGQEAVEWVTRLHDFRDSELGEQP